MSWPSRIGLWTSISTLNLFSKAFFYGGGVGPPPPLQAIHRFRPHSHCMVKYKIFIMKIFTIYLMHIKHLIIFRLFAIDRSVISFFWIYRIFKVLLYKYCLTSISKFLTLEEFAILETSLTNNLNISLIVVHGVVRLITIWNQVYHSFILRIEIKLRILIMRI